MESLLETGNFGSLLYRELLTFNDVEPVDPHYNIVGALLIRHQAEANYNPGEDAGNVVMNAINPDRTMIREALYLDRRNRI